MSNINAFHIEDFNGDGQQDILGVGNLFVSEIETPRNDAGVGMFLTGAEQGSFTNVPISQSGFYSPLDAKKMAKIHIAGTPHILVANNNDRLQLFKIH